MGRGRAARQIAVRRLFLSCRRFACRQIIAHFFHTLWAGAFDGAEVVRAFEKALGLARILSAVDGPMPGTS